MRDRHRRSPILTAAGEALWFPASTSLLKGEVAGKNRPMPDLDLYLLRAFLAVVEIGTVNGAAASLNRTLAAVSMQIRKLEGLVGKELFERSTKGLELTADGQILAPFARELITLNDEVPAGSAAKSSRGGSDLRCLLHQSQADPDLDRAPLLVGALRFRRRYQPTTPGDHVS